MNNETSPLTLTINKRNLEGFNCSQSATDPDTKDSLLSKRSSD